MTKKSKIFRKKFFGQNRFRMVQNVFQNEKVQKFLSKIFFRPQNFEKPLFLAIFEQKIYRISEHDKTVKGTCEYDSLKEPQ